MLGKFWEKSIGQKDYSELYQHYKTVSDHGMTPFFSSTKKVDCPDGPRYILKHPEKAFAITFPEWDVRVKTLVKRYSLSEGKAESKILKRTKSIVKNLTENYAALQAHYQAAYLGWCGNPSSKEAEKAYNDAKAKILERVRAQRVR